MSEMYVQGDNECRRQKNGGILPQTDMDGNGDSSHPPPPRLPETFGSLWPGMGLITGIRGAGSNICCHKVGL